MTFTRTMSRLATILLGAAGAVPAAAQLAAQELAPFVGSDSVTVVADSTHGAGGLHRFFFGTHYRDLWTAPMRVPILDLARFDGGLTPTKRGGGFQTKSLRFKSANGREWAFRSMEKDARTILAKPLRESFVVDIVNDQTSHAHPGGGLVIAALASALGVLHVQPQFAVMPDDRRLGEFREDFAGKLGQIELFPDTPDEGNAGLGGARKVVASLDLLEELREDPAVRIDARGFLTARLLDLLVNDWDRHKDQWRWALVERDGVSVWEPIPRDRDQAFFWIDGLLPGMASLMAPKLVRFTPTIPLNRLIVASSEIDHAILAALERPVWDSIAAFAMRRLSDSVIDAAERRLPPSYLARRPGQLSRMLKSRRDGLDSVAAAFYDKLARFVDVHATDIRDVAVIDRATDGTVEVTLRDGRKKGRGDAYFRRRFRSPETREVRVYLHGGDDSLDVRGAAEGPIVVRVVGGKGDDAAPDAPGVRLYEFGPGPKDLTYGRDTLFDRRPQIVRGTDTIAPPPDFGGRMLPTFRARYYSDLGLVVGAGAALDRFAFRHVPYDRRYRFYGAYATGPNEGLGEIGIDLRREGGGIHPELLARATGLEVIRYYGQSNESVRVGDGEFNRLDHRQYSLDASLVAEFSYRSRLEVGPTLMYARTGMESANYIAATAPYGAGDFGQAGLRGRLLLDTRHTDADDPDTAIPTGIVVEAGGSVFPAIWDATGTYGDVRGQAAVHLAAKVPFHPALALRAGAQKVFGDYPFFASAFLGGNRTLRGYDEQRFAGNAMAYGNAELRLRLARFRKGIPGDLGLIGLGDVGRVWADGESSDEWHHAFGGGFWFGLNREAGLVSVTLADGPERVGVYVEAGFGF